MTTITHAPIPLMNDISGAAYLDLLDLARRTESLVGLVWREQLTFSATAQQLVADLEPNLVEERLTDEWPGTRLFGHQAWYRLYRCDEHSLPILARAKRLFGWLNPDFPEDISFHLPTGECWLNSVAHEAMCRVVPAALSQRDAMELTQLLKQT